MEASKPKPFHPNKRLRAAREQRGWSQAALAHLIGTTELTVGRWERGERTPQLIYRAKLCDLFAMSAEDLGLVKPTTIDISTTEDVPTHTEIAISSTPSVTPTVPEPIAPAGAKVSYMKSIGFWSCLIIALVTIGTPSSLLLAHAFSSPAVKASTPTIITYVKPTTTSKRIGALVQSHQDADPTCLLVKGKYHLRATGVGYCLDEKLWLADFAYSVHVAIHQGTQAGIIFRAIGTHFYYFSVDIAGHYYLDVVSPTMTVRTLVSGFNHVVVPEAGQTNLLAVAAHGTVLRLYVNGAQVGQVQDRSYTRGYVGICVGNYYDMGGKRVTEADFWDAKV